MSDDTQPQEKTDVTSSDATSAPAPDAEQRGTASAAAPSATEKDDSGAPEASSEKKDDAQDTDKRPRRRAPGKRNFRSRAPRREKIKPEFDQKIISIRRVTRVMAGGRRFSFSVAMVLGDRNGRVGLGTGKANDTALAIQKAVNDAKRNMVKLDLQDDKSIKYEISAKFKAAQISLRPNKGRGLVAGSSVRTILEFAGIDHTSGSVLTRSRNKLNNARAAMKALEPFVIGRGAAIQSSPKGERGDDRKRGFSDRNSEVANEDNTNA